MFNSIVDHHFSDMYGEVFEHSHCICLLKTKSKNKSWVAGHCMACSSSYEINRDSCKNRFIDYIEFSPNTKIKKQHLVFFKEESLLNV